MKLELGKLEFHATQIELFGNTKLERNALFFFFYGTRAYQARVPSNMELEFGKLEFLILFFR